MTDLEKQALSALCNSTMRIASNGKRFRNQIEYQATHDPEFKLTEKQALLLWDLVYTYRRQIKDPQLIKFGEHARVTETLPAVYQSGDHREPAKKEKRPGTPKKSSRYQLELRRGGGKLAL